MVGWGGVVQTDYLVEPRLSWTGLGCDNYRHQGLVWLRKELTQTKFLKHFLAGKRIEKGRIDVYLDADYWIVHISHAL